MMPHFYCTNLGYLWRIEYVLLFSGVAAIEKTIQSSSALPFSIVGRGVSSCACRLENKLVPGLINR